MQKIENMEALKALTKGGQDCLIQKDDNEQPIYLIEYFPSDNTFFVCRLDTDGECGDMSEEILLRSDIGQAMQAGTLFADD